MLESYVLMHLANTLYQSGNIPRAARVAQECERSARIADSRLALPWSLILQMLGAHAEARHDEGLTLAREAAGLFADAGDRRGAATSLIQCGMLETSLGRFTQAADSFLAAIPDVRRFGYTSDKHDFLMETALLAQAAGFHAESLTLLSANVALRAEGGSKRSEGDAVRVDAAVDSCRSRLKPGIAGPAWHAGESMPLDNALDLAVACCQAVVAGKGLALPEEDVA